MNQIGLPELLVLTGPIVFLICGCLYVLTLKKALERCGPASRTMEPNLVWLLLIPILNTFWHFYVVIRMSKSLRNEFDRRGFSGLPQAPGKILGLVTSILSAVYVPTFLEFNVTLGIASFVSWIIYWIQINRYSKLLQRPGGADIIEGQAPPPFPTAIAE